MTTKTLKLKGMHCPSCALLVEGELEDIGVSAKADYPKGIVTVTFDESKQPEEAIHAAIRKAGYSVID
jgi:copper chaperone CopZ